MRRLLTLAVLAPLAFATTATARPPLPCDYWVHGCDVAAYVHDVCDRHTTLDCGIV
jgi:hypothetical protein